MRSSRSSRSLHDDAQSDAIASDDEPVAANGGGADDEVDEDEEGEDMDEDEYAPGAYMFCGSIDG